MKKIHLKTFILLLCCFLPNISSVYANPSAQGSSIDKTVAIVNDQIITQKELDANIANTRKQMAALHMPAQNEETIRQHALDSLINHALLLQIAKNAGLTVSDAELDASIKNIMAQNHMTENQMKQALAKEGLSFAKYRDKLRDEITLKRLQAQALAKKVIVNDQEVETFLKNARKMQAKQPVIAPSSSGAISYRVIDFIFPIAENASADQIKQSKNKAQELIDKMHSVTTNEEFAQIIKTYKPMDLGYRKISEFPDLLAKTVEKLRPGELSNPISAPNGIHVLRVIDIKGGKVNAQAIALSHLTKDQAREYVYQQKLNEASDNWLKELRSHAYIKIINE